MQRTVAVVTGVKFVLVNVTFRVKISVVSIKLPVAIVLVENVVLVLDVVF